jgi:tmRNA-binding protein
MLPRQTIYMLGEKQRQKTSRGQEKRRLLLSNVKLKRIHLSSPQMGISIQWLSFYLTKENSNKHS